MNKKTVSIWNKTEALWPIFTNTGQISFINIAHKMMSFLVAHRIYLNTFSHFGVVVNNIETSLKAIRIFSKIELKRVKKIWVESYDVYVYRNRLEDKELEFVEPVGESLFYRFLKEKGEGLNHIGFVVRDIQNCLNRLKVDKVKLIDSLPRSGSHGKIAFLFPELFDRIYIELCQK